MASCNSTMSRATQLHALLNELEASSHDEDGSLRLLMQADSWREAVIAGGGGGPMLLP